MSCGVEETKTLETLHDPSGLHPVQTPNVRELWNRRDWNPQDFTWSIRSIPGLKPPNFCELRSRKNQSPQDFTWSIRSITGSEPPNFYELRSKRNQNPPDFTWSIRSIFGLEPQTSLSCGVEETKTLQTLHDPSGLHPVQNPQTYVSCGIKRLKPSWLYMIHQVYTRFGTPKLPWAAK
jgi:hypothetical protein